MIVSARGNETSPVERDTARALGLAWFTGAYNLVEGAVSVVAGWSAGTVSLLGFGVDSFIEVVAAGVVL